MADQYTQTTINPGAIPLITSAGAVSVVENTTGVAHLVTTESTLGTPSTHTYSLSGTDADLFTIGSHTGAIRFKNTPDYEVPLDADGNNSYDLTVTISSEFNGGVRTTSQEVSIAVTNQNDIPTITSATTASVAENTTDIIHRITATDEEGTPLSYSLSGIDADHFTVDSTGAIRFNNAPDYEAPLDAGGNNGYTLTVITSDGVNSLSQGLFITVTNVNEAPIITSVNEANTAENTAGTIHTVTATDVEGNPLTYNLSGTDAHLFTMNSSTGAIRFTNAPDYEAPLDADGDNVYDLTVAASDGIRENFAVLSVTVTDEDETPTNGNAAPIITSPSTATVAENTAGVVHTVTATDPEGAPLTYTLSGTDANRFTINNQGAIRFTSAPDYEVPLDAGSDNVYNLIVTASDGVDTTSQGVSIAVTDVNEVPVITSPSLVYVAENTTGVVHTVTATNPEGTPLTYSLLTSTDAHLFTIDNTGAIRFNSTPDYESPLDTGSNNSYALTVEVSDGVHNDIQVLLILVTDVVDESSSGENPTPPGPNVAPIITSPETDSTGENNSGVIYRVTATDADGDPLTYSLSGTDANRLNIDAQGAIRFNSAPDYESPLDADGNNVYDLLVTVSDGVNTASQEVSITVNNTNESPTITSGVPTSVAENTTGVIYTVTATDAEGDAIAYSLSGTDANQFNIDAQGAIRFNSAPDYEAPVDADGNNVYELSVTASDGVTQESQGFSLAVTDVDETPTTPSELTIIQRNGLTQLDNGAFDFDGNDDYGELSAPPVTGANTTLSAWVNVDNLNSNTTRLFEFSDGANRNAIWINNFNNDDLYLQIFNDAYQPIATTYIADFWAVDTWVHLTIVIEADGTGIEVYKNGASVRSTTAIEAIAREERIHNYIGGNDLGSVNLDGQIGAIKLVDQALTAPEVAELYNSTHSPDENWDDDGSDSSDNPPRENWDSPPITKHNGLKKDSNGIFDFDGKDDYGELSDPPLTGADTTFSAWINYDTFKKWSRVYQFSDAGGDHTILLSNKGTSDHLAFHVYNGSNKKIGKLEIADFWELDTWVHVTTTIDDNGELRVYKNGVLAGSSTASKPVVRKQRTHSYIGNRENGNRGFDGQISHIQLIDRVLSAEEVTDLYNNQGSPDDNPTPPEPNAAPTITSPSTASVAENTTGIIHTVTATDPEADTLTYSLSGTDANRFTIDAQGAIRFNSAPDYEAPVDAGGNNVYNLTVTASDEVNTTSQGLSITVTNVEEAPTTPSELTIIEHNGLTQLDNGAFDFDGKDDYGELSDPPLTGANTTFSAWINYDTFKKWSRVYQFSDKGGDNTILLSNKDSSDNLAFHIYNGSNKKIGKLEIADFWELDTWVHVTTTIDDNGELRVYKNGVLAGSSTASKPVVRKQRTHSYIGDRENGGRGFDGQISDIQLIDRVLSAQEVTDLYNNQGSPDDDPTPPAPNQAPIITSASTASVAENTTGVIHTVTATNAEGDAITYSLSGTDAQRFTIDAQGAIRFNSAPDYEAPVDAGGNNVYDLLVTLSDGVNTTSQGLSITVNNTNESPTITSAVTASVAENTTGVIHTVTATDVEGDAITYSLSGTDANRFNIDAQGAIRFNSAPDYEAPVDADGNNVYDLLVTASDGVNTTNQGLSIIVTDVDDTSPVPPVLSTPTITSHNGLSQLDDGVFDFDGNDDYGTLNNYPLTGANTTLSTWVNVDGFNSNITRLFEFNNGINGINSNAIWVSNFNNTGLLLQAFNDSYNLIGTSYIADFWPIDTWTHLTTVIADDGRSIEIYKNGVLAGQLTVSEAIAREKRSFNYIGGNNSGNVNFDGQIANTQLADRALSAQEVADLYNSQTSPTVNPTPPAPNAAPTITSASTASVAENSTGIIHTVTATDPEGDTLTYSLSGTDAQRFTIDAQGAIRFTSAPDYEAPVDTGGNNVYDLTVMASDGVNTASQALSITVTQDDESLDDDDFLDEANSLTITRHKGAKQDSNGVYSFDGKNDYAKIVDQPIGGAMTVSAWVNYDSFDRWSRVFDFGDGNGKNNILLANNDTSNDLALHIYNDSGKRIGKLEIADFWEKDTWIHVTTAIDANGNIQIYKNGALAGTATTSESVVRKQRTNTYIGRGQKSGRAFNGQISDIQLFDRALSQAEVATLYDQTPPAN